MFLANVVDPLGYAGVWPAAAAWTIYFVVCFFFVLLDCWLILFCNEREGIQFRFHHGVPAADCLGARGHARAADRIKQAAPQNNAWNQDLHRLKVFIFLVVMTAN